jgi:hypothetical protein
MSAVASGQSQGDSVYEKSQIQWNQVPNTGMLPTDCLQATPKEKARYLFDSGLPCIYVVPER